MTTTTQSSELANLDADRLPFEVFVFLTDWKSAITPEQAENFFRGLKRGRRWSQSALVKYLEHCLNNYPNYWKDYSRTKEKYTADKLFYRLKELAGALSAEEYTKLKVDIIHLAAFILTGRPYRDKATDAHPTFAILDDILHHRYSPTAAEPQRATPIDSSASSASEQASKQATVSERTSESTVENRSAENQTNGNQTNGTTTAAIADAPAAPQTPAPTTGTSDKTVGQTVSPAEKTATKESALSEAAPTPAAASSALAKLEAEAGNPQQYMPYAFIAPGKDNFWVKGKIDLTCTRVITETHDVKTFRFTANPPCYFQYKPGQFVTLELMIDGKKTFRSYTLSSTPSRPNVLGMTVKRVPGGLVSNWLHDNVTEGTVIKAKGPFGSFTLFDHPHPKILLISAGSGATPMMSMLRWLVDTNAEVDVGYFHWASTKQDIIFHDELEYYNSRCSNLELGLSLTREDAYSGWDGLREYVSKEVLESSFPDIMERRIFVCGPEGFMKKTRQIITEWGFPLEFYHEEAFGVARPKKTARPAAAGSAGPAQKPAQPEAKGVSAPSGPAAGSSAPAAPPAQAKKPLPDRQAPAVSMPAGSHDLIAVQFADSHLEIIHKDSELTILEMADECGIEIPSSCRSGTCGTCKARKISGKVTMEGAVGLDEDEEEEGYILTCVSYAEGFVKIEA